MDRLQLSSDKYLVFVENKEPLAETTTSTRLAKIISNKITLLTNKHGQFIDEDVSLPLDRIVSNKPYRDIYPRYFYKFNNLNGTNFVDQKMVRNTSFPLVEIDHSSLGSGIFGFHMKREQDLYKISNGSEVCYKIECKNPLIVQDVYHLDSIIVASRQTNNYLAKIFTDLDALTNLWNIAMFRNGKQLDRHILHNILSEINMDKEVIALPINNVLSYFNYDSILTDTLCVSISYDLMDKIIADRPLI